MKLGLNLGYWAAGGEPREHLNRDLEAERLGYDCVWTAEAYGWDAVTPLTWIAARTKRIKVGTAMTAETRMSAATPILRHEIASCHTDRVIYSESGSQFQKNG